MTVCSNCGEPLAEGAKFCPECGTPLGVRTAPEGRERKVVTVLFCDLADFTAASERADPEDVQARLGPYHARVRGEIEHYGGIVEKFVGDAVMAVFGAPAAHEDDPERAVRAGLRILEGVADLNTVYPSLDLRVRIGINTGEALVSLAARPEHGEGMVMGDVVNTASRLQGAAPVDGIAVGESTYVATKDVFDYEPMKPVHLKGKAEPVRIWRAAAARWRFGTDLAQRLTTPLVGRELERSLLTQTFERSVRDRSVHLITIVGEPGVGKSRLVAELVAHIDAIPDVLVIWRQGRCLPYGDGITFWALGEVVKGHAGVLESDPPEAVAAKLDRVLPEGSDREWIRQRLLPLLGIEATSGAEREEEFTAWRRFLESIAESRPAVFVFEDLHWADEPMLAFLEHLADFSEGVPMLLVCTARPELFERAPSWAASVRNSNRINIGPLTDAETAMLVSNLLDRLLVPAEIQGLILERAEGNPLYAEEVVRLLMDRGILVREGNTWAFDSGAEVPLPSTVQGIIAARLDTLAPDRKAMLQDAAVVGKVFWAGAVAFMAERDPRSVAEGLHELSRREFVRPARASSIDGEAEYSFWHVLVREVAYAQIPRAERAGRHRRAAAWIEGVVGDRLEDLAGVLAHHYTSALELATAAGRPEEAKELEPLALRYLVLAGERALGLDTAKAEAQFSRALELAPPGDPFRPEIMAKWAEAVRQAGRHAEAAKAFEEAVAFFRATGEDRGAARAMTSLANLLFFMGDARSREVAAGAVALLESLPPGADLVAAYAETARLEGLTGDPREGIAWAERAMALAAELGLEESAKAVGYRGLARCWLGDAGGVDDFRRAEVLALAQGLGWEAAVTYDNLAVSLWSIEGPDSAMAAFEEGIAFAQARGMAEFSLIIVSQSLDTLVDLGSWDEVLETGTTLARRFEGTGSVLGMLDVRRAQVRVLAMRGEAATAVPLANWEVEAASGGRYSDRFKTSLCVAAQASLAAGDTERARALVEQLEQMPNFWESLHWPAYLTGMVRTAVACGDQALAERLTSGPESAVPYREHALVAARAILAEARGQAEEAASLYAEASGRWERFGVVPERAFALLGRGRSLLALGRTAEAVAPLREARDVFASLRAVPAIAETDALLERAVARTS